MDTVGRLFKVIEWFGFDELDSNECISPITLDGFSRSDQEDLRKLKEKAIIKHNEYLEALYNDSDNIERLKREVDELDDKIEHLEVILEDDEGDIF
jgi:3-methyladenine DNA glycosylase Tag